MRSITAGRKDHNDRLPVLAAAPVRREVAVLAAPGSVVAALAAKAATATVPVVFVVGLELPKEIVSAGTTLALIVNPTNPKNAASAAQELQQAADRIEVKVHILNASTEADFEPLFAPLADLKASGLVITNDTLFIAHARQLAELTLRHSLPAAHQAREFARLAAS